MNFQILKNISWIGLLVLMVSALDADISSTSDETSQSNLELDNARPESCDFDASMKEIEEINPNAYTQRMLFEDELQQYIVDRKEFLAQNFTTQAEASANSPSYIIPVVFHVYGTDFEKRPDGVPPIPIIVDQQRIKDALAIVNENFVTANNSTDLLFSPIEGGMNVEFKLAQIDPDGNTTTGIVYHEYQEGFALNSSKDADIVKYAWDNYKYFNVYIQIVLKSGSRRNSGTAWLPRVGMSNKGTARIVYNGKYLIDPASSSASSITHEFGHWLNLHHTFSGGCVADPVKGDEVADTPPTEGDLGCGTQANCFGEPVNSENHMDYNTDCEFMFTQGQVDRMEGSLQHAARITLWQDDNLLSTGVKNDLGPRVIFNYQEFADNEFDKFLTWTEHFQNDGSILNTRKIKAVDGATFSRSSGTFTEGVDFIATNVPAGLSAKITLLDNTTAEISLDGQASAHETVNNTSISITLLDNAISGGTSSFYSTTGTYKLKYINAYGNRYGNLDKQYYVAWSSHNNGTVNTGFDSLLIGGQLTLTPTNFDGDTLTFDNKNDRTEFLSEAGSGNIRYLAEGVNISQAINGTWQVRNEIKEFPPILTSQEYTAWHGKTGYVAMRIPTILNNYLYGWLKVNVSSDGSTANIIGWGINELPDGAISTGVSGTALVSYSHDRLMESNDNDGSIANSLKISLDNTTFATQGTLIEGTHYSATNIPDGLQLVITANSDSTATVSITGNADEHGWDFDDDTEIIFLDAAFDSGNAAGTVSSTKTLLFEYIGESFITELPQTVVVVENANNGGELGGIVFLTSHNSIDRQVTFQTQFYTEDDFEISGFKFITGRKDAIANANYELTPLDFGTEIGPNSLWQPGREYWSFRGQHMIDSDDTGYHNWRGKTKYIGVRFRRSGKMHYGWVKARLNSIGDSFEFLEIGVSGKYETGIIAGTLDEITVPTVPMGQSPIGTISSNQPTFTWTEVPGTRRYAIFAEDSNENTVVNNSAGTNIICPEGICSYTKTGTIFPDGAYTWKVRIIDPNNGVESSILHFNVDTDGDTTPVGVPTPLTPNTVTDDNTPTFTWSAVAGINKYAILAYSGSGTDNRIINNFTASNLLCPAGVCSYTFEGSQFTFPDGVARWQVRTEAPDGSNGAFSEELHFNIETGNSAADDPAPLTPNSVTNDNTPTLTWTAAAGISKYAILAYSGSGTGNRIINNFTASNLVCPVGICSYTFEDSQFTFPDGVARWQVRTEAPDGTNGDFSDELHFTVETGS